MVLDKKRKIEMVILAAVILIAVTLIGYRIHVSSVAAKETALLDQLRTVRSAVSLYVAVNKVFPPALNALTTEKYTIGSRRGLYLTGIMADPENFPVDSFEKRFNYDPRDGRVWAGEKKYVTW